MSAERMPSANQRVRVAEVRSSGHLRDVRVILEDGRELDRVSAVAWSADCEGLPTLVLTLIAHEVMVSVSAMPEGS